MSGSNGSSTNGHGHGPHPPAPRLVRFGAGDRVAVGVLVDDLVREVALSWPDALAHLADGDAAALVDAAVDDPLPLAEVELEATLAEGGDVYCVGLNYLEHQREAVELVDQVRDVPIIFAKSPRAMTAPNAELVLPGSVSVEFDFEVELGVVIGRDAVAVAPENAWAHVAGYCVVNDITARDLQKRHQQWHLGKNIPASTPIGPWVVARDSLPTPPDVAISLEVNGIEKQSSSTALLIHDVPTLIALLSSVTHLRVGDVIATGTPAGVGFKRTPPEYLADGDVVVSLIEGVGSLTNVVRTWTTAGRPAVDGAVSA